MGPKDSQMVKKGLTSNCLGGREWGRVLGETECTGGGRRGTGRGKRHGGKGRYERLCKSKGKGEKTF